MRVREILDLLERFAGPPARTFGKRTSLPGRDSDQEVERGGGISEILEKMRQYYIWNGIKGLAQYSAKIAREAGVPYVDIYPHLTVDTLRSWDRSANHRGT